MKSRPIFFEAACIFSIIGSSIGFITMFFATLFYKQATVFIRQLTNETATEKLSSYFFAMLMAAHCISLIGAIKLYRMQRIGLYFYLIAQTAILFLPVFQMGSNAFSTTNAIFTLLFSAVYLYYFRATN